MTKARDLANAADVLDDVSATELSYVNGVTSAIQTQLNAKQAVVSGVNDTEIGYLDGVSSAIQTQLDAKTAKSTLTTTGDIYYASAANTPARLGIGSTGNVLTVAAGIPSWAAPAGGGGMTELASGSLAASATGFDLTSISGAYNELWLYIANLSADATGGIGYNSSITFNNDTGSNYSVTGTLDGAVRNTNNSAVGISLFATETAGTKFSCVVRIPNYTDTTSTKVLSFVGQNYPDKFVNSGDGIWTATPAAINRITLKIGGGAYDGGTYKLYGVK